MSMVIDFLYQAGFKDNEGIVGRGAARAAEGARKL